MISWFILLREFLFVANWIVDENTESFIQLVASTHQDEYAGVFIGWVEAYPGLDQL